MTPTPDIAGWKESQDRLIDALGVVVEFRVPLPSQWGPTVAINEETGEPYDPTVVPVSGGNFTTLTLKVGPVFQAVLAQDPLFQTKAGVRRSEDVALILALADGPLVAGATEFTLFDIDYRLTEMIADGLVNMDRYVVYGEAR